MKWLPVTRYEGLYEVSDRGQVRAMSRVIMKANGHGCGPVQLSGRVLQLLVVNQYGHLQVGLWRDGLQQRCYVHRLVLEAFVGSCPDGQEARHGPGGPQDNRWPENLCWGTHRENESDKCRDGTDPVGIRNPRAVLSEDCVREIRARYVPGEISQRSLADEFGVSASTVQALLAGRTW